MTDEAVRPRGGHSAQTRSCLAATRRLALVIVFVASVVACGSDKQSPLASANGASSGDSAELEFCKNWLDAFPKGDDARLRSLLADPPASIRDLASKALAEEASRSSGARDEATQAILQWIEVHCHPEAGTRGAVENRRLAPSKDTAISDLMFCGADTSPSATGSTTNDVVLYGEGSRTDPYDGPMLGVVTGGWDHKGDGTKTPVRVRGTDGVAAPITVFQQVTPEGLGTVIAWQEQGMSIGLYGRFWDSSRTDELVAFADKLEFANGQFRLPAQALPDGYTEVFTGSSDSLSLPVFPFTGLYGVRFQSSGSNSGLLTVGGRVASQSEFEAFRFLALNLDRRKLGDRDAIVGNAWHAQGPAVVTWREPDGLVIRIVGLGVDLDKAIEVANATRELSNDEWVQLVEASRSCEAQPN